MTDVALARRNIVLLAISQALYSTCVITLYTTAGIVGLFLAPKPSMATLPVTFFVVGAALATIPASMLMQRVGRLPVFIMGGAFSVIGAGLSFLGIITSNFWLFSLGCCLQGVFQSTSGFYRFAAIEGAPPEMKPKAISWVLTGGVVAAVVGTVMSAETINLFPAHVFAGCYAAVMVVASLAIAVLSLLRLPEPVAAEVEGPQRSWAQLLQNPLLPVSIASAVIAYGLMNFMMTAAPVAMKGCGFSMEDAAWVIQWHVLAMYVPSFITGSIIVRIGAAKVTAAGMVLLAASALVALSGISFGQFSVALVLLGLGWNFGFIGATSLLTTTYLPSERGKVQGVNDFFIAVTMAIASYSSGQVLANFGWAMVGWVVLPVSALALGLVLLRGFRPHPLETA